MKLRLQPDGSSGNATRMGTVKHVCRIIKAKAKSHLCGIDTIQ